MIGEIWRDIKGYEGLYQISNLGRVKSLPKRHSHKETYILKPSCIKGYLRVFLTKNNVSKSTSIHRLLAIEFIDNPENKPYVNHIDGNKSNNDIKNLEWCTQKENCIHAIKTGLNNILKNPYMQRGDKHPNSKPINQYDLENNFIKRWGSSGEIKRKMNINVYHVILCCKGKRKTAYKYKWKYA